MKMTQFARFANDATEQMLGESGLVLENLQSMFSYPNAINMLEPVTVSGNLIYIRDGAPLNAKRVTVYIEPLQVGNGDPTGWTGITITRLGKNLANIANNTYTNSGVTFTVSSGVVHMVGRSTGTINRTIGTVKLSAGVTYTISGTKDSNITDNNMLRIDLRNSGGGVIASGDSYNGFTYTAIADLTAQINIRLASGNTVDFNIYPQIEIGIGATEFEPYTPNVNTINFPSEAGTVYRGTLDITEGVLIVEEPTSHTYQLTPVNILLLDGINTIYADCGPMELEYYRIENGGEPYVEY